MIRITLSIPEDTDKELENFAEREHVTKAEAMRRALALIKVSNQEAKKGRCLGVIDDRGDKPTVVAKLIGV